MPGTQDTEPVNKGADKGAKGGLHDEVAMLSVRADGSPDQYEPEFVGDPEQAEAATTEQFRQQAVSAADRKVARDIAGEQVGGTSDTEDPTVKRLQEATEAAAKGAEKDASAVVKRLHPEK